MPGAPTLTNLKVGSSDPPTTSLKTDRFNFWVEQGLFNGLEVRGRDDVVPSKEGMVERNRKKSRRVIEVQGNVLGQGVTYADKATDFINQMQLLESYFPLSARRYLRAELTDGSIYTIRFLTLNFIIDSPISHFARINLELESVVPDWTIT